MPIHEGTPQKPTNPYGESKLMFERILEWYFARHGMRSVRLRYFNAAGAIPEAGEDHTPETHIIPIAIDVARGRRESLNLYGTDYPTPDGTCVRDYIHVADLADAHIRALENMDAFGTEMFNLGTGTGFSVREVIHAVEEVTGKELAIVESPRRPGDPPVLVASPEKAAAVLGWKAQHTDLVEIVSSAWDWFLANPNGYPE
jgi:UDP-glucose 4-epimerase